MKLNYLNRILEFSFFKNSTEAKTFFENQKSTRNLFLSDTYGENSCVVKCMDSLSREVEFCLGFSSETKPDELSLITMFESDRWIVQVDNELFFISLSESKVVNKSEIYTPLIGLHLKESRLLILEEAGLKVVDKNGKVLQEQTTDLIDTFELKNSTLSIFTVNGERTEVKLKIN